MGFLYRFQKLHLGEGDRYFSICFLFHEAVSILDYVVSNDRMI
jgi:hypothetical protein